MVAVGHVEAGAGHDQHVFLFEHLQREAVVVEALRRRADHARETVQRARRGDQRQVRAGLAGLDQGTAGFVEAAAGPAQRGDGVGAVQRLFDRELPRHVGAQAQRAEQVHRMVEVAAGDRVAGQHRPADPPAAGAMHLGQAAEAQAGQVAGERRDRLEHRVVVQDVVVDLVDQQQQAVALGDGDDALQQVARVVGAGRVVGVDQHDGAGARGHQRLDLVRVRQEAVVAVALVVDRAAVVEDGGRAPQRVVGRGHQHFLARVEQGAQGDVDQLADPVAHEHALRRGIRGAARLVEGGDRLAGLGQALLVGVRVGALDAVGDRALQVLGGAEAEGAGIADVELDQLPALALQLAGAPRQFAADLVADFGEAGAGGDLVAGVVRRHRCGAGGKRSRQRNGNQPAGGGVGRGRGSSAPWMARVRASEPDAEHARRILPRPATPTRAGARIPP